MLTQKSKSAEHRRRATSAGARLRTRHVAARPRSRHRYFEGDWVPMRDAKVSIMTHAFMYGTATFEGIRGYWNEEQGQLYGLFIREHIERIRQSAEDPADGEPADGRRADTPHRRDGRAERLPRGRLHPPLVLQETRAIGVRLHHLDNELYIIAIPFGNYIDTEAGVRVMTSTWRRNADEALPARGKIVGGYVNMAFQKSEAEMNGFDEAVVLTADGHVDEASAANLFMVRDGVALTPPVDRRHPRGRHPKGDGRAPGGREDPDRDPLDRPIRALHRDEMFLCGTGVQISPVVEIDHRPIGQATSARSRS